MDAISLCGLCVCRGAAHFLFSRFSVFFRKSVSAIAIAVGPLSSSSSSKCLFAAARMKLKRVVRVCYLIGESIGRHRIEYKMREQEYMRQLTMATTATTMTKRMRPIRLALHSTKRWHFFAFAADQIVIFSHSHSHSGFRSGILLRQHHLRLLMLSIWLLLLLWFFRSFFFFHSTKWKLKIKFLSHQFWLCYEEW